MKGLSTSRQDFRRLIETNSIYVDKTQILYPLLSQNQSIYFFSRPRRFGKSLLCSTLKEIFLGSKDLFEGLWIHSSDYNWKPHPVIHLDMSSISHKTQTLAVGLAKEMHRIAEMFNVQLPVGTDGQDAFKLLIAHLSQQEKVVVIIDEYDKPLLDVITEEEKLDEHRRILKGFYGVLKSMDAYLRFVFVTGITKFSKVSLFSDLNHLQDISLHQDYTTLVGWTQQEIKYYYSDYLERARNDLQMTEIVFYEKLKDWYNGYSWDGAKTTLYNPFGLLNFMSARSFLPHWFDTGTPSFLIDLMKKDKITLYDCFPVEVSYRDIDNITPESIEIPGLLFQTGYLTIQSIPEPGIYILDYPNREVKESFLLDVIDRYAGRRPTPALAHKLKKAILANDLEKLIELLNILFAGIPHNLFLNMEAYYHSIIHIVFSLLGFEFQSELHVAKGRADCVLHSASHIYVFEFKLGSAQTAIDQIHSKKYYAGLIGQDKKVVLVGIGFDTEVRQIHEWVIEEA